MQSKTRSNLDKEELLREVIVKIGLERLDMQEEITVEILLDSGTNDELRICKKAWVPVKEDREADIYKKCG